MRRISSASRSNSSSQASNEAGSIADAFTGKDYYQDLIDLANTIPLSTIFKRYNIYCNESACYIRCPFKSHKGGREGTASFKYYHETDSFCCFGCHVGGPFAHAAHFVASMEGISTVKAAHRIIELYRDELGDVNDEHLTQDDHGERLKIMLDFSSTVREFHQTYSSEDARVYIELVCKAYDSLSMRHKHYNNEALARIVEQLKERISLYKP